MGREMDEAAEPVVTRQVRGLDGTAALAAQLAPHLRAGDAVLLTGELAAGKTTFTAAVLAALGSHAAVSSPTFSLANFYDTPGPRVLHVDTYRLADVGEFRDLGLEEYLDEVIALVEWGGMVAAEFVDPLAIHLAAGAGTERTVTIRGAAPRWAPVLAALAPPVGATGSPA